MPRLEEVAAEKEIINAYEGGQKVRRNEVIWECGGFDPPNGGLQDSQPIS